MNKISKKSAGDFSPGRLISVMVLPAVFLTVFSACGIPSYPSLYPPVLSESRTNPETGGEYDLIFINAYNNNSSSVIFKGYELYYKIYDPLYTGTDGSSTRYITDRDTIAAIKLAGVNTLKSYGFTRLFFTSELSDSTFGHDESLPSFNLDPDLLNEVFKIRLLCSQDEAESYYASVWKDTSGNAFDNRPYFYRWVQNESDSTESRKFFGYTDFDINDSDLPASIDLNSYNESLSGGYYLYISFYIMSYGVELENVANSVYSEPLYLGTLKFDCELKND